MPARKKQPAPYAPRDATSAATPPWMSTPPLTGDVDLRNPGPPNEIRKAMRGGWTDTSRNPIGASSATGDEADGMRTDDHEFRAEDADRMASEAARGFRADVKKKIAARKRARS